MHSESQLNLDRSPQVQVGDKSGSWRMRNIVAFIPSRTRESHFAPSPRPYVDGQLLELNWMAPEAGAYGKSHRSKLIGQIMLFCLGATSTGLFFSSGEKKLTKEVVWRTKE